MSKIYEALKQAQKEKAGEELAPEVSASYGSLPFTSSGKNDSTLEKAMIGLYQNIESLLPNSPKKIVQFIGSREGEGASTLACEFGRLTAGKLHKSVLILDADRTNPKQHLFFGITPRYGWDDMLRGETVVDKVLYQVNQSTLYLSPVSPKAFITNHALDTVKIGDFLKTLIELFDLVIVDTPPATSSPDGIAISRNVSGVVLVVEAEKTRWPVAENAKDTIEKNGGKILGAVFNKRRCHMPDFVYKRL